MSEVGGSPSADRRASSSDSSRSPRAVRPESRPGGRPEDRSGTAPSTSRPQAGPDVLWDVAGVAAYLDVPVGAIYRMTGRRAALRIPHIRIGTRLRFRRSDIDRWLSLLTVSTLDRLTQLRRRATEVSHGHDSQTTLRER